MIELGSWWKDAPPFILPTLRLVGSRLPGHEQSWKLLFSEGQPVGAQAGSRVHLGTRIPRSPQCTLAPLASVFPLETLPGQSGPQLSRLSTPTPGLQSIAPASLCTLVPTWNPSLLSTLCPWGFALTVPPFLTMISISDRQPHLP